MCDQDPQRGAGIQEVVEGWEKKLGVGRILKETNI